MGSTAQVKNNFTFVGGFITEASALTFPENASIDEENFDLKIDGSRPKRQGFDYEEDFRLHVGGDLTTYVLSSTDTFTWDTVGEVGGRDFLVVQRGSILNFFDISNSELPLSTVGFIPFVDLNDYLADPSVRVGNSSVSMTSGKGLLFVNSEVTNPLHIRFDDGDVVIGDLFKVTPYTVNVRDLEGMNDLLDVDERPIDISINHNYNLRNQGWPDQFICATSADAADVLKQDPVPFTKNTIDVYPSNADIIYLAKVATAVDPEGVNSYWPEELDKHVFGTTSAPKGKFILDHFYKDRSKASGIGGIAPEIIKTRPEAVAFYAGRVFLGYGSDVFYSQILTEDLKIDKFHSEADPSAEDINQVIATDGGTIKIPDAGLIKQLLPLGDTLIVLATGGIWQVDGARDPFAATNNRVNQISTIGVVTNKDGLVVENSILFNTPSGIYSIATSSTTGDLEVRNITETTIDTYYLSTVQSSRPTVKGIYDPTTRKVYWLWTTDFTYERFHDILILDTTLGSFHKYRLNSTNPLAPFLSSAFITPRIGATVDTFNVITSDKPIPDNVVDSLGNDLVINRRAVVSRPSTLKFLAYTLEQGELEYTFAEIRDRDLVDWASSPLTSGGEDYEAFMLTGYDINDDIMRYKQAPLIQCAFNKTESAFVDNGQGGSEFDFPSSCKMSAFWDWSDNSISGKITDEQEVYRFRRPIILGNIGEPFVDGYPVVTSRTKVRGRGRSLHLRFRSPPQFDTDMLGWALLFKGNDIP